LIVFVWGVDVRVGREEVYIKPGTTTRRTA
jgi:hypothetical protein